MSEQNTSTQLKEKAVRSALKLAEAQGWSNTSMCDIAREAAIPLDQFYMLFETRDCVLNAYGRMVDRIVLSRMGDSVQEGSVRERLFDILMERFDVLNEDREAVLSILNSFARDPKQFLFSAAPLCRSMAWMMELAGEQSNGWCGAARVAGLSAVYMRALKVWMEDHSPDMPKTMATLDRSLGHADQMAQWLRL